MSLAQQDNGGTGLDGRFWMHFSGYEIWRPACGWDASIIPSRTASGTVYDPMEDHRRRRNTGVPTALDRLLSLARPTVPDEHLILEWVRDFGLFGLLPHEAVTIRLPPLEFHIRQKSEFLQDVFVRHGARWRSRTVEDFANPPAELVRLRPVVCGISDSMEPEETLLPWEDFGHRYFRRRVSSNYFDTDLRLPALLGLPTTSLTESWSKYGEPLEEWVRAAQHFARAVMSGDCIVLDEIASRAGLTIEREGLEFRQRMRFSSLLSALAMIAIQELTGGFRPVVCAAFGCGKTMLTSAYQRRYCSDVCQWRQRKRAQRANASRAADL